MSVQTERAAPDSWERYRKLRLAALRESPEMFGSTWEREDGFDPSVWKDRASHPGAFLAVVDDRDAGIGGVYDVAGRWFVMGMWVDPAYRGRGVVDAIVARCEAYVREQGGDCVHLGVIEGNGRGISAYRRLGFSENGNRESLPDGRVELMMQKALLP